MDHPDNDQPQRPEALEAERRREFVEVAQERLERLRDGGRVMDWAEVREGLLKAL